MSKYIHKTDGSIVHCPSCRGVIIKHAEMSPNRMGVSFTTVCPHCKKSMAVEIQESEIRIFPVSEKEK